MINPKIDDLLLMVNSKYKLVTLAARRARQINNAQIYFKKKQASNLGSLPTSVDFSIMKKKPVTAALEEIAEGRTTCGLNSE